jgi:hypothetical protein
VLVAVVDRCASDSTVVSNVDETEQGRLLGGRREAAANLVQSV